MPIPEIIQPEILPIGETLRLRKYDGECAFALSWYQDEETVYLVDGTRNIYTPERLRGMYDYLNRRGELYFIEVKINDAFVPIGDVTFWKDDMPIVIGDPHYRGKGIGKKVIAALIQRARHLGYKQIQVADIYDFNTPSQKCFTAMGFFPCGNTEKGKAYNLNLD